MNKERECDKCGGVMLYIGQYGDPLLDLYECQSCMKKIGVREMEAVLELVKWDNVNEESEVGK